MGAPGRLRSEIHGNVVDRAVFASVAVVAVGPSDCGMYRLGRQAALFKV